MSLLLLLSGKKETVVPFDYDLSGETIPDGIIFTRADSSSGCATRVNSLGVIEAIASNTPRFDYDPVTLAFKGLLLEASSKNLLTNQNDLTAWTPAGSPTITKNNAGAPDGTSTLNHFQRTSTSLTDVSKNTTKVAQSVPFVLSAYVKNSTVGIYACMRQREGTTNYTDAKFNMATGVASAPVFSGTNTTGASYMNAVGNSFYRIELYGANSNTTTATASLLSVNSNGGKTLDTDSVTNSNMYIWGLQLEFNKTRATSLIIGNETRATDSLTLGDVKAGTTITVTFDDDSTQSITASSSPYTIDPTTLNRRWVKRIQGFFSFITPLLTEDGSWLRAEDGATIIL